jgi:hypothetical protein
VHIAEIASDSSVEIFAEARPIILTMEGWSFLVLSFLVSSFLIVLSIFWQRSLFDSIIFFILGGDGIGKLTNN